MAVSKQTVIHTSKLARLNLAEGASGVEAEARIETFARQMDQIVAYMNILDEADTKGVEPMFSPMSLTAPPAEDKAEQLYTREEVLANAPKQEDGLFIVPRVL